MQIIVFTLGDEHYAIKTSNVEEITKDMKATRVPNSPEWVNGLINLRGNVITLVDLYKLLNKEIDEEDIYYNGVIIVNMDDEKIGILVTEIVEVIDIEAAEIQDISQKDREYFCGIIKTEKGIINIIDMNILLSKNEG